MASICRDKNGTRRILFCAPDGKRKAVRLGKVSQKLAEAVKVKIEALLAVLKANHPLDAETATWVNGLDDGLADKLAAVGLIARRQSETLVGLLDVFDSRKDVKPATKVVWGQARRNLIDYFGKDTRLRDITPAQAEDFHQHLVGLGLASWTIHKRLQFCRMFFRKAIRRGLIHESPFSEISHKKGSTVERQRFVTRAEIAKVMAICNLNWRVILALARFGGLRCPSEVLTLKWEDVNWETERFLVRIPKTEHHEGREIRLVPIFPELRPVLEEAYKVAQEEGHVYVVNGGYREAAQGPNGWKNANLRTQFGKYIKRAGLVAWPRLFHNLRASRETELVESFPIQVVTSWLGNTPAIAMQHYLQVRESDFQKAVNGTPGFGTTQVETIELGTAEVGTVEGESAETKPQKGGAESGAPAAQNAAQHTAADAPPCSQVSTEPLASGGLMAACLNMGVLVDTPLMEDNGLEPMTFWLPATGKGCFPRWFDVPTC